MTERCPYKGPHPLGPGDPIYGRKREISGIYDLVCSNRIVLVHAPSGAGKTSIVQAGLLKRFKEDFTVWGPIRVNTDFDRTIAEDVRRHRQPGKPLLIIFDQFEEILTTDPLNRKAIEAFFQQLGELLLDAYVFALFLMRDDYLAALDPWRRFVPTHFTNRYRIDFLTLRGARDSIQKPAASVGCTFTPEAVTSLVLQLSNLDSASAISDEDEEAPGIFVEPVYLQVVCTNLWSKLERTTVTIEDIQRHANVSAALANFYESRIQAVGSQEAAIREWFGEKLITPGGIRTQVLFGAETTEGLPNATVLALETVLLIRRHFRSPQTWYEVAHDRLVQPILESNRAWNERLGGLERASRRWVRNGRQDRFVLAGDDLNRLMQGVDLTKLDADTQAFVAACDALRLEQVQEARMAWRVRHTATAMAILFGMASAATLTSYWYITTRTELWDDYSTYILIANLVGGLSALPVVALFRRDQRAWELLQRFTRKHRTDASLQSIPTNIPATAYPGPTLDSTQVLDQSDQQVLAFVPYWALLIVAGSDGWISNGELNQFRRLIKRLPRSDDEVVADRFLADPRPATIGLTHAAAILQHKMPQAEADDFRRSIDKVASGISKPGPQVNQSLDYIARALRGEDLTGIRPGTYRYFTNSEIYSKAGVAICLVGAIFAAILLGFPYNAVQMNLRGPALIARGLLLFVYSFLVGVVSSRLADFSNTRNRGALTFIAAVVTLAAFVFLWVTRPSLHMQVEFFSILIVITEIVVFFTIVRILTDATKVLSYCESCGRWADLVQPPLILLPTIDHEQLTTQLENGQLHFLEPYIAQPGYETSAREWISLSIESCESCGQFHTLTAAVNQLIKPGEVNTVEIFSKLLINPSMAVWIHTHSHHPVNMS